jgi:catechol 2,3-dioxygenase-like lactoylglutathione lyase family enzyme
MSVHQGSFLAVKRTLLLFAVLGSVFASVASAQVGGERRRSPFLPLEAVGGCGGGNICNFANVINNSMNQEKTLAFYETLFGFEWDHLEKKPELSPYDKLFNAPGVWSRRTVAVMPGALYQVEFTEWSKVPLNPVVRRIQDPGHLAIIFRVRDVDATLALALRNGATTVTTAGKPLEVPNARTGARERSIFLRDPDGAIFGLQQASRSEQASATGRSPVISVDVVQTTKDPAQLKKFWDAVGGVDVSSGTVSDVSPEEANLWGIEGATGQAQVRRSVVSIVGTKSTWNLYQFINVPGIPRRPHGIDPGATQLQFRLIDTPAAIEAARQNGGSVLGIRADGKAAVVYDPDNLVLIFVGMTR